MPALLADLVYLVALVAGDSIVRMVSLVVLFVVILAVRDGLAQRFT